MKNLRKKNFREKLRSQRKDNYRDSGKYLKDLMEMSERIHNLIGQVKRIGNGAEECRNLCIRGSDRSTFPFIIFWIRSTGKQLRMNNMRSARCWWHLQTSCAMQSMMPVNFTTIDAEKDGWKIHPSQQENWEKRLNWNLKFKIHCGKCKIHKMLLQPFVENAIKYSFRGYEGAHRSDGQRYPKRKNRCILLSQTTGKHIEEDQLKDLNMEEEIKNHFGISNVRKRLKLYYGEDAVIYFENVSQVE